jgi:hypothetical protein
VLIGGLVLLLALVLGAGAMFAFNIGPFAKPAPTLIGGPTPLPATATPRATGSTGSTPTGAPTASPRASATASSSSSPGASPQGTASAVPSGDIAATLLSHIPSVFSDTCFVSDGGDSLIALAVCNTDGGAIQLTYFQYSDRAAMVQTYEGFRLASQIEPDSGDCADHATWPAENPYSIDSQTTGRFLCTEALGQTSIYWTDNRLNILSQASHTGGDFARLFAFWKSESGPIE